MQQSGIATVEIKRAAYYQANDKLNKISFLNERKITQIFREKNSVTTIAAQEITDVKQI